MHDVAVIGGSIAGAAIAIHLAARGLDVVVLERAPDVRPKACGEGLFPLGVAELERLGWIEFNVHRALGEQTRTDLDRLGGMQVIRRNTEQLPRILRRIDPWLALLNSA